MEARNKEQVEILRTNLKLLSGHPSWTIIRKELQEEIKLIEQDLFEHNERANEKVFTLHDMKRIQRKILILLTDLPENLFETLKNFQEVDEDDDIV